MYKKQAGQILVLVLLIVVVSLAVGLAAATRNLTNIRTSTQTEQSQRAFTAAEGGVESTLSNLNKVAEVITSGNPGGTGCTDTVTNVSTKCPLPTSVQGGVNLSASGVVVEQIKTFERTIKLGDVAQVNLLQTNHNFDVHWLKSGDPVEGGNAMEFSFICDSTLGSCAAVRINGINHSFAGPTGGYVRYSFGSTKGAAGTGFATCPLDTTAGTLFSCKEHFELTGLPKAVMLRIKPLWNNVTVKVAPENENVFPVQIYKITSTVTTDTGLTRKVQVTRDALPVIPAIFDYVLYSGQDIKK